MLRVLRVALVADQARFEFRASHQTQRRVVEHAIRREDVGDEIVRTELAVRAHVQVLAVARKQLVNFETILEGERDLVRDARGITAGVLHHIWRRTLTAWRCASCEHHGNGTRKQQILPLCVCQPVAHMSPQPHASTLFLPTMSRLLWAIEKQRTIPQSGYGSSRPSR